MITFKSPIKNTNFDHGIWRDVFELFIWGGGGLWWGNSTRLPLRCICFGILFPWTRVSEDTYNKQIYGKHDDRALNSDHDLLPGELDMTCKGKVGQYLALERFLHLASCWCFLPRSMVCSEGSVGMPQNMMLVSIVQSNSEKQQDTRCTRVKVLQGGRLMTENHMWPSWKSLAVFMKNKLLKIFTEKGLLKFLKTVCGCLLWVFVLPEPLQIRLCGNREDFV